MKKFLSLVLALVMAMSLVTISAGATEFKDLASADEAYQEAIDLISDLGIVGGVTADTFQPKGTLTRGAATKFVANLMLGPDLAAKLPDGAPFTDVPAGSTFAKFASYLKSQGVIGGYGNGSFGVKNGLTGDAFLKMVLGALGYDAAIEGYGVDGWQVNVALDAISAGLVDGMVNFDSSKVITREQAAQIVLNALEADTVKYTNKSTISIGNVVINNNSEAEVVTGTATKEYTGGNDDGKIQLIEKLFPGVYKNEDATDTFGRPAVAWYDNTKAADKQQLTLTVEKPVKVYGTKQTHKTIATLLGLKEDSSFIRYVNGSKQSAATLDVDSTSLYVGGASGATTEIYYHKDETNPVIAVQISEYIGKVTKVTPKSGDTKRFITITPMEPDNANKRPSKDLLTYDFTTEDFAEKDIVIYTYANKKAQTVELAQSKTGELTMKEATATIYVDGAKLAVADSATLCNDAFIADNKIAFGDTVKAYLNSNGYYMYVEKVSESTKQDKYAYVLAATTVKGEADWATGKVAADTYKAQLLFTDGTTEIVETKASVATLINNFVKYGINTEGKYELTDATTGATAATNAVAFTKGNINATVNGKAVIVNNATTFIYKTLNDKNEAVYTVYVGYKAAPSLSAGQKALSDAVKADSKATAQTYVFVDATAEGALADSDAGDTIIYVKPSTVTKYVDKNGAWYKAMAITDGAIQSVVVKGDAWDATLGTSAAAIMAYDGYAIDADGNYTSEGKNLVNYNKYAAKGSVSYADGVLLLEEGKVAKQLDEKCVIIYMNSRTSLEFWTVDQLAAYKDSGTKDNTWTWLDSKDNSVVTTLIIGKN